MGNRFTGLWRHPDFLKLWAGETISLLGSQITLLALPLTAVLTLKATPAEMGVLGAVEFAPFLLLALFAGVWVDRLPRRPILMVANLGRALCLSLVPVLALFGLLRIEYLYAVGFLVGVLMVFFDVAYQSCLPALVSREHLVEGNSKLEVSRSIAQIAGPGLAGTLVQIATAPFAILLDAVSFLVSALCLGLIRGREVAPTREGPKRGTWAQISEGLQVVLGNRVLRAIAGCTGTSNLFGNLAMAVFLLYATRDLGLAPALLGLIFGVGSVGGLLGALLAGWVARRLGLGPTIIASSPLAGVATLIVPLASGPLWLVMPLLVLSQFLVGLGNPIYNVNQVSLRQAITPDRLQGRMNASVRFLVWGTIPIGSLIGGFLGEAIGLRPTLVVGGVGELLAVLWVLFSPVRLLRRPPEPSAESAKPAVVGS